MRGIWRRSGGSGKLEIIPMCAAAAALLHLRVHLLRLAESRIPPISWSRIRNVEPRLSHAKNRNAARRDHTSWHILVTLSYHSAGSFASLILMISLIGPGTARWEHRQPCTNQTSPPSRQDKQGVEPGFHNQIQDMQVELLALHDEPMLVTHNSDSPNRKQACKDPIALKSIYKTPVQEEGRKDAPSQCPRESLIG